MIKNGESNNTYDVDDNQNNDLDYSEKWPDIKRLVIRTASKLCSVKLLTKRIPILKWLPAYRLDYLPRDFISGITVGLTAIPQSIAYAVVAGLEPQYGLYSGVMGCFAYCIFGGCKDVVIGTTTIMALMINKFVQDNIAFAWIIAFFNGIVVLAMGFANLGFLVRFISIPVTVGFMTAAALNIGTAQVRPLLGLPSGSNDFIPAWINVFTNITKTKLWDTVLGVLSIIFLLILYKLSKIKWRFTRYFKTLALARNALVVIIGTTIAYLLTDENGVTPIAITGPVAPGFPEIKPPPFEIVIGNKTLYFGDIVAHIGLSIITIPMVAILEIIAISKAFSKGKPIDSTQQLIALGVCNVMGSFFSSMPTTGSFTRTAVNNASGVKTTLGSLATVSLILLSLSFLTQTFQYIPKATLASVIISAMFQLVDFKEIGSIWRTRRLDFLPFLVTLLMSLWLGLEYGIVIGIGFNLLFILYITARPKIDVRTVSLESCNIMILTPDQNLMFSAADYLKFKILKLVVKDQLDCKFIVVDGGQISSIDVTVVKSFLDIVDDVHINNRKILFWNWKPQPVGMAWRHSRELGTLFIKALTVDELIIEFYNKVNEDIVS